MLNSVLEFSHLIFSPMSSFDPISAAELPAGDYHVPVLREETLRLLAPAPGRTIVDGTVGGGGHTEALLAAGAQVIGLDRDAEALAHAGQRLAAAVSEGRLRLVQSDFRRFDRVLDELGVATVDGLLLDLGVSSRQLNAPGRGFSFQQDGPLDMRMDQRAPGSAPADAPTAADLVNTAPVGELARWFRQLGEEPAAGRAAAAIVAARAENPILTTLGLAEVLARVLPRRGARHPATRVFQALRMAVNDELGALGAVLETAAARLAPGGRLAVISFHSLEDRPVKSFLRETTAPTLDRPEWPAPRSNPRCFFRSLTRRPLEASAQERAVNPRARSAKLRGAERLDNPYLVPPPAQQSRSSSRI